MGTPPRAKSSQPQSRFAGKAKVTAKRRTIRGTNALTTRLGFESLEDRRLLALVSWDGETGNGLWNDRLNWDNDTMPTAADDVTINVTSSDITVLLAGNSASVRSLNSQESITVDAGVLLSLSGPVNSSVSGALTNSGAVHVQGAGLTFLGGGTSSGAFTVDAGASLLFEQSQYTLDGVIEGAGEVAFRNGASATVPAVYNVTGSTTAADLSPTGTLNFMNVQSVGSELFVRTSPGASINFFQNAGATLAPLNVATLTLHQAVLNSGPIQATNFNWRSGTLTGTGDVDVTGTLTLSNFHIGDLTLDGRTLNYTGQNGLYSIAIATQGNLHLINRAVFNNHGTLETRALPTNDPFVLRMDGDGTFNNTGTIVRTNPNNLYSGGWRILVPFTNSGAVHVQGAGLTFLGGGTSSGAFTVDAGASLLFDNGEFTQTGGRLMLNGGLIRTANPFNIHGGELLGNGTILGSIVNGGTTTPGFGADSPDLITVDGNYVQTSTGALNVQIGGLANGFIPSSPRQYDQLGVNGAVDLDGALDVSLFNGFVPRLNDEFLLINNDGTDAVSGQFDNNVITIGSVQFEVHYNVGLGNLPGNDVVLKVIRVAVNEKPVAHNQPVSVTEDGSVEIKLSGSDAETAEANLTFQVTSLPTSGALSYQGHVLRQDESGAIYIDDGLASPASFIGPPTLTYEPGIGCGCSDCGDAFSFVVTDRGDPENDPNGDPPLTSDPGVVTINITSAVAEGQVTVDAAGVIRVGGTAGDDDIRITHTVGGEFLEVALNGTIVRNDIPLSSVHEIRSWGRDGNDRIAVIDLAINALLDGGLGDDELIGAAGRDLLFGGMGNDWLTGAAGDDFLIGGAGADRLVGSAGHDVLVAGEVACHFTDDDLRLIALDWAANRSVDDGLGEDVLDELADGFDTLTGSSGADWFIISSGDKITDFKQHNVDGDVVTVV